MDSINLKKPEQHLLELANQINSSPAHDTPKTLGLYLDYVIQALSSSSVIWLAFYAGKYGRDCWKTELMNDWKIVDMAYSYGMNEQEPLTEEAYLKLARQYGLDPLSELAIQTAGKTRVLHASDVDSAIAWNEHPTKQNYLAASNVGERMLGFYHLDAQAEICLIVDRESGAPLFTQKDKQNFYRLLMEFPRLHYWLCLERGILPPADRPLTPRYQEVIRLLHQNYSENEIAERLGIAQSTTHSYIIDLYKMFHVNSRAELIQLWSAGIV